MASIYFSDFFAVDPEALDEYGAFNVSLVNDLPAFVDPFLLFHSVRPEYQELHETIIDYMRFLKQVTLTETLTDGLIQAWFAFPEVKQNWLGFSITGNAGHGLGRDFAKALHANFHSVFRDFGEELITKSSHIEKLCLVRSGVGRDNLSDFTTNLIRRYLATYTQEFAKQTLAKSQLRKVALRKSWFNTDLRAWVPETFELPWIDGDYVLLTPRDILTKDDAWINRGDLLRQFDDVAESLPDSALRAQLNDYLFRRLSSFTKKEPTDKDRDEIRAAAIDAFPKVLDHYIKRKEDTGDQAAIRAAKLMTEVQQRYIEQVADVVATQLDPAGFYRMPSNTFDEAKARLLFLKDVIENKGGHRLFYDGDKAIQRESDLQVLYRLTWYATPSVVSREVNDGRGPVDFQVARSPKDKVLVELKLAKNTQLARNLEKQCAVYEAASDATRPSIKGILYFSEEEREKVSGILSTLKLTESPTVVLIDARRDNKPSGSKA